VPLEDLRVTEELLLGVAEGGGDGVAGGGERLGVANDVAVLDVDAADLAELAGRVGQELGDDGDLLVGVDSELGARAVEGLVALAE
jgi:hypothetical protein